MNLSEYAHDLLMEGFNPLPLKANKAPLVESGHSFLYEPIDDIDRRFAKAEKIGIACGKVSGGFYCIDFDSHNGEPITDIFEEFINVELVSYLISVGQLSCYTTAGGGYHIYFRFTQHVLPGKVFAHWETKGTMIELRGNGQYVACFPSKGYAHLTGVEYIKLEELESIIPLLELLPTFSKYETLPQLDKSKSGKKWAESWRADRPEGKYNLECSEEAKQLLIERGWQKCKERRDGVEYWTRPNKDPKDGFSATWGRYQNMFYIFTNDDSVHPLKANQAYSPFNIYTELQHRGDWKNAKEELKKRFGMSEADQFWSTSQDGKYSLNNYMFKKFLESYDFFKNVPKSGTGFDFVRKEGIFLKIVYEHDIKDFVIQWIEDNEAGSGVFNLMTGNLKFFKREFMSMLKTDEVRPLKDDKDTAYLFYRNCIVKVTQKGKEILSYKDTNMHIWKGQVIDRDFIQVDHHNSEYRKFIWNISSHNKEKYKAFQTVIGYLLHSYKSNSNNKAIIFNDELISDEPNGRSGKGLFWNALKYLKKVQSLDGKTFDFNKAFPYQNVSTDCQILVFDDVKKSFQFESLFSVITEGITIEYKGKDSIKLDVTESPKIIITTNYTIKGDSASFNARKYEVEMSAYYNDRFTPIMDFGHELFNEWSEEEWARFDAYMMECLRIYLEQGLIEMPVKNLNFRKLVDDISSEFYNFMESLKYNEWKTTKDLYDDFLITYPEKRQLITQNKVTISYKKFCQYHGIEIEESRNGGVTKLMMVKKEQEEDIF